MLIGHSDCMSGLIKSRLHWMAVMFKFAARWNHLGSFSNQDVWVLLRLIKSESLEGGALELVVFKAPQVVLIVVS